jgi:hypothetical protein
MRDLVGSDRTNGGGLHSGDGGGVAVERCEFHFERLPVWVDMNHGAHVTPFEALSRHWFASATVAALARRNLPAAHLRNRADTRYDAPSYPPRARTV